MSVLPVMERELRAEARQGFNYWLRDLGASVLLGVFVFTIADQGALAAGTGTRLFENLNTTLFLSIWILVPLLTADCISRERREGTLDLLFLTQLTPLGIVLGKLVTHALRAGTMILATLPILALPFLVGGISGRQVVSALLLDAGSVCLALAAGLLASCLSKTGIRALFGAEIVSILLWSQADHVIDVMARLQMGSSAYWSAVAGGNLNYPVWGGSYVLASGLGGQVMSFFPSTLGGGAVVLAVSQGWVRVGLDMFAGSFLVLAGTCLIAARRLRRLGREVPPSARRLWIEQWLIAPRFGRALLQGRTRRTLERNPIGWLEQHSAGAGIRKWGWCLFILLAETIFFRGTDWNNPAAVQYELAGFLAVGLAFSAAGSFRRERESGAMELILVTPLRVGQIILGRLRGLWAQFLPSLIVVSVISGFLMMSGVLPYLRPGWNPDYERLPLFLAFLASTFATLPAIGLYFSLSQRRFLVAWTLTLLAGLLLPELVVWKWIRVLAILSGLNPNVDSDVAAISMVLRCGAQLLLAGGALVLLLRNLKLRRFAVAS